VTFTVHPPVEFLYALNFTANEKNLYKFYSDFYFTPPETFKKNIENIKGNLSRYAQNELKYFFEWRDMIDILGKIILDNREITRVSEFIDFLDRMDEKELRSYITGQSLCGWDDMVCLDETENIKNIVLYIRNMDDKGDEEREKLLECVQNTGEMRSRLCLLMRQFYEKGYRPIEDSILSEITTAKERYEELLHDDPDLFDREYLGGLIASGHKEFVIHISYFTQIRAWTFNIGPFSDVKWVNLGIYTEHYPRGKFVRARVQSFVKILSDKKRFEMVELLGKRQYYVHELSAALELTPPTVCYHLNSLLDSNLVSMEKGANKTYYSLNKETVRDLLKNAGEVLLGDE
jgi:Predicted transcriptional regulators